MNFATHLFFYCSTLYVSLYAWYISIVKLLYEIKILQKDVIFSEALNIEKDVLIPKIVGTVKMNKVEN